MPLETTFLSISDDIGLTFPCSTRHLKLFDRAYLLCPEEILCIYGLDKDVDSYIDTKLK
jgi:hypothetical protein